MENVTDNQKANQQRKTALHLIFSIMRLKDDLYQCIANPSLTMDKLQLEKIINQEIGVLKALLMETGQTYEVCYNNVTAYASASEFRISLDLEVVQ